MLIDQLSSINRVESAADQKVGDGVPPPVRRSREGAEGDPVRTPKLEVTHGRTEDQRNESERQRFSETDPRRRAPKDAEKILALMKSVTKEEPRMWGSSIIGFGRLHYKYASGREGDWFKAGFSPRKDSFTLYLCGGFNRTPT